MPSANSSVDRSRSVSSSRRMNRPPCLRAHSQLWIAVRILPTWSRPVGAGAKRVTTFIARGLGRGSHWGNGPLPWRLPPLRGRQPWPRKSARMKLMSGNSNLPLVKDIAAYLEMPITEASVRRFADEEVFVEIHENVRGQDVFVVQSTSYPANDNLMELLICIDALRRASAKRITAVVPYFGYARQDRKPGPRTPISAKLVANLITVAGANRVLSVDLHAGQIQGFFDIPTDNLYAAPAMAEDIQARFSGRAITVVSPDVGGVVRARALAKRLDNAPLAIVDKRREKPGESEVMNIIGDVAGRFRSEEHT